MIDRYVTIVGSGLCFELIDRFANAAEQFGEPTCSSHLGDKDIDLAFDEEDQISHLLIER